MSKTLRILLVGAALIGAAAPALAQSAGGGNGGGGGGGNGGGGGGSSNVWDASIPASAVNLPPTTPQPQQPAAERRDDTCGQHRGRGPCRVR